jgi:hypothetical protein
VEWIDRIIGQKLYHHTISSHKHVTTAVRSNWIGVIALLDLRLQLYHHIMEMQEMMELLLVRMDTNTKAMLEEMRTNQAKMDINLKEMRRDQFWSSGNEIQS